MTCGDGAVVVAEAGPNASPPAAHSVMIRVPNVDAHFARARAEGARSVQEPTTFPYGERQYTAVDPGESVDDVDPATWGGVLHG